MSYQYELVFDIPNLTPVETLASLAAEGKFASINHQLPINYNDCRCFLNGEEYTSIVEVYAPGDDSGWALAYVRANGEQNQVLVHGNWKIVREV